MIIVKVVFIDWNGEEHTINVTDDMCYALTGANEEADVLTAIHYVKRRYTEWYNLKSVERIAW